ncbi:uncharacterized protein LOC112588552 [Harpegnathos saltator]|uniref:uncharacterized protein LOC112588552 n=1 Tax=Harpegnathos saltator TaxID=610380 RepID=UPI000DBEE8F8|nr:uncharacterized protein LOC112588552 [Harpegnathos saltator]
MGKDGILNEVWKYGGEEIEKWAWEVCRRVWEGEEWPEDWKEGIIIPIRKKGKGEKVTEYRGVTLMPSLYKIYTAMLAERVREEVEEKRLLSESQAGFSKGIGSVDMYVLNYLINRQLGKKGGKLIAMFVNLNAAFDHERRRAY